MARELPFPYTKAERVFKLRYSINIPKVFTISQEFLKQYQPIQTGDREIDEALFTSPISMLVTPAGMAMYLAEGASFVFNKPTDIVDIYEDTYALLMQVMETLNRGFNPSFKPPMKNIAELDNLCQIIYTHYLGYLEIQNRTGVEIDDIIADFSSTRELNEAVKILENKLAGKIFSSRLVDEPNTNRVPYPSVMRMFNDRAWRMYGDSRYNTSRYR